MFATGVEIVPRAPKKTTLDEKIENEEYRLTQRETRLIRKFAYLEKVLALLESQMAAAGILSSSQ